MVKFTYKRRVAKRLSHFHINLKLNSATVSPFVEEFLNFCFRSISSWKRFVIFHRFITVNYHNIVNRLQVITSKRRLSQAVGASKLLVLASTEGKGFGERWILRQTEGER